MKAWAVTNKEDPDAQSDIVWAETSGKAKQAADTYCDSFLDLRARRIKKLDDKEGISRKELDLFCWRELYWVWEFYKTPDPYITTDEEFNNWWDENFSKYYEK